MGMRMGMGRMGGVDEVRVGNQVLIWIAYFWTRSLALGTMATDHSYSASPGRKIRIAIDPVMFVFTVSSGLTQRHPIPFRKTAYM